MNHSFQIRPADWAIVTKQMSHEYERVKCVIFAYICDIFVKIKHVGSYTWI